MKLFTIQVNAVTVTPLSAKTTPQNNTPATDDSLALTARPDKLGRFGRFGGKYVPETLMPALKELEEAYYQYRDEAGFQAELEGLLKDYVGRANSAVFC